MTYLDTSVALAALFAEDRRPADSLWNDTIVSCRLLEYELWTRVNARGLAKTHDERVRALVGRIAFVELVRPVLARVLEPFTKPIRTLDALHLASMEFLRSQGQFVKLASYDERLIEAAREMKFAIAKL
ncbi:MAG: PIN domain-containing protein [Gemmatimonadaceae bacterium]